MAILMKAIEQYFHVVLFIILYKVVLTFKDVRAQKFPGTDFLKLLLQVENDKIRCKNVKKIGGHRTRFEDKAYPGA